MSPALLVLLPALAARFVADADVTRTDAPLVIHARAFIRESYLSLV